MIRDNVQIITLGCPKNDVDSEVISKIVTESGRKVQGVSNSADTVLINTCGFIEDAVKESKEKIYEALERKNAGEIKNVFVAGCMVKRFKEELEEEFSDVDQFFGVTDFSSIRNTFGVQDSDTELLTRKRIERVPFSYLKISEGCNYTCSFCAIPSIRGSLRSRSMDSLVDEAKKLVDDGAKELVLISEDTTKYGTDLQEDTNLVKLIQELDRIPELRWMKVLYAYPTWVSDDLLDTIASSEKMCNYLDMPIQHVSDKVLRLMKRTYKRRHIEKVIQKFRDKVPDAVIRTTAIVGFPGEKKEDFIELSDFLYDIQIERLGVFAYSDEPGTHAATLPDKNAPEDITERFEELQMNQDSINEERNSRFVGKTIEVLIDSKERGSADYIGRTYADAPSIDQVVRVQSPSTIGDFKKVEVTDYTAFELIAS